MYNIGGVTMQLPIIVGAGACKKPADILPYMRADVSVGSVSFGSSTPDSSLGNEGTLFWPPSFSEFMEQGFGLNSFGMPNIGHARGAAELKRHSFMYPVIASIAGSSPEDFVAGIRAFHDVPCVAAIKLNVGCPNKKERPVPIAYDLDLLSRILEAVAAVIKELQMKKPIWIKLSPYIKIWQRDAFQVLYPQIDFSQVPTVEPGFLGDVLAIIWEHQFFIRAVIFSNTLANVIYRDESGKPVTTPNGGRAGFSGNILRPVNIDLIRQAATMLPGTIDLIESGGVSHGDHAVECFEGGASAVCYTSGPFWSGNGPRFSSDFLSESEQLQNYLAQSSQLT